MGLEMVRKLYDYHRFGRTGDCSMSRAPSARRSSLGVWGALSRPPSKSTYPSMNAFKLRPRSGWRSLRSALASI